MEYKEWLDGLTVGSQVQVRHPWFDKIVKGGEYEVKSVTTVNDRYIKVDGVLYDKRSGKANFNDVLEPVGTEPL